MSFTDDLERLAALHRSGALSDAEFAGAKARMLGTAPSGSAVTVGHWLRALRRSRDDRWLGGVCGGLGSASGLPSWLCRLIFVALLPCGGSGLVLYLLLWVLLPLEDGIVDAGAGSFSAR